ncbi:MAG: VanZ family protein [Acidobacteriota bacterium]
MRSLRYWLPAVLWSCMILAASTDLFSAAQTGSLLDQAIRLVLGHSLPAPLFALVHELGRKCGHISAYGIASALYYRAIRKGARGWSSGAAVIAIALAAALGSIDETHQSFIPSRSGTPADVAIDTLGAILAQLIIYRVAIPLARRGVTLQE